MMRGVSSLTIAASGGRAQAASWAGGASGCVWLGVGGEMGSNRGRRPRRPRLGGGPGVGGVGGRGVQVAVFGGGWEGRWVRTEEGVRGGRDWAAGRGWESCDAKSGS